MLRPFSKIVFALSALAASAWCSNPATPKYYLLGPDDRISVRALNVDELNPEPVRINMAGDINLAIVGRIHAGGMTVEQLESEIGARLKRYVINPTVFVSVIEYRSQPISILGAVTKPGVYQLEGHKTLFEALSLAQGLQTDAGNQIHVTRRKEWGLLPLPGAVMDPSGEFSTGVVSIKSIMEATNPKENILMEPDDVVSVPKAKMVYVVGSVRRPGGFVLSERESLSVLQAVSLAEGLERTAASQKAVILRSSNGTAQRTEVPIDVKRILSGKSSDMNLQANDILFVPNNTAKSIALKAVEVMVQTGSGVAIYK